MTLKVKISKKLIPYKTAISFLEKRVDLLKKGKNNDLLWILEHPLTFTQGIRSKDNEILDKKNIGVWVKKKKIAAIGLRVTRWIAYHGCSINIDNNLDYYKKIIPCGLDNNKITSVKKESNIIVQNIEVKLKNIFLKNLKNI